MGMLNHLIAYGLRQVLGEPAAAVLDAVQRHFTDHSQALPKALERANNRAWQTLAVALTGNGWMDSIKVFFLASGEEKGFREEVGRILEGQFFPFEGTPAAFRKICLTELKLAQANKLLSAEKLDAQTVGRMVADLRRYSDPHGLIDGAYEVVIRIADELKPSCPNLASLLRQRPAGGPPLLGAAFAYFFRRELETNAELARGLIFDGLRQLAANQEAAFGEVGRTLEIMGGRFDQVLDRVLSSLEHISAVVEDTNEKISAQAAKLDNIEKKLVELARRSHVQSDPTNSAFHITITNEREQALARWLLEEVRKLPPKVQTADLLGRLGDVLRAAGRFKDAQESYATASMQTGDKGMRSANLYKTYLVALEQRHWKEALAAIIEAATLEPERYAPFPLTQYEPRSILGAGGFGTAFKCFDRYMKTDVVIKSLFNTDLERGLEETFAEAHALRHLSREHPSIIGVQHCSYAGDGQSRAYIVMDYFDGISLQTHLDQLGAKNMALEDFFPIAQQIVVGMKAAHTKGIVHRDLKPDNVLIRQDGTTWQVRIIDFGLAIRTKIVQVSTSVPVQERTLSGESAAGTALYASPEQMGKLKDALGHPVRVGPYSDVYAFGKLCCQLLFRTTEPKRRQWAAIPEALAETLERCTEQDLKDRFADFEPVLEGLVKAMGNAAGQSGPLPIGAQRFAHPFVFPSGLSCGSFEELVLACYNNWQEALDLVRGGYLERFLGVLGRADLASAARQAAQAQEADRGLDDLLNKLHGAPLVAAKLQVDPPDKKLGVVQVGEDRQFELTLKNKGDRLVYGKASVTECPWLALGDSGSPELVIKFFKGATLPVRIRGDRLSAFARPQEGEIVLESSGGNVTVVVHLSVPVKPFPEGVLAGALNPRQIAEKAKLNPKESAPLFEKGDVATWYKCNGWNYPVQGPLASGLAAVQQYFEAQGLVKAPKVDISHRAIQMQGNPGDQLTFQIEVKSEEKRPVYAHGATSQPWVEVSQILLKGHVAVVNLTVLRVPDRPGETLKDNLTVHSNGNQRFIVPIILQVGQRGGAKPSDSG